MDIKKLLKQNKKEVLLVWVEWEGFQLQLEYADKKKMDRMLNRTKKREFKNHQPVEVYDDDLFAIQLAGQIKDWKDLTYRIMARFLTVPLPADQNLDQEIPFTTDNAEAMVLGAYGLNTFIRNTITHLASFRQQLQEEQEKNSETSQGRSLN